MEFFSQCIVPSYVRFEKVFETIFEHDNIKGYTMLHNLHGPDFTRIRSLDILSKLILEISVVEIRPYLLEDSTYHGYPYVLKFFKVNVTDLRFNDKKYSMSM